MAVGKRLVSDAGQFKLAERMMNGKYLLAGCISVLLSATVAAGAARAATEARPLLQETTAPAETAGTAVIVVDDFEDTDPKNSLGGESGSWTIDPDDTRAFCTMELTSGGGAEGSKGCLKLSYSVDSKQPAVNGYWTKLQSFDAIPYDRLEFDVRGDAGQGFTTEFRVEIKKFKDQQKKYKLTGMKTVKNATGEWQRVSIPLTYFNGLYDKTQKRTWDNPESALQDLDEFVIVFHQRGVTEKKGALYFDNLRFVKTGEKSPSVFDRPPVPEHDKAYIVLEDTGCTRYFLVPAPDGGGSYEKVRATIEDPKEIVAYLKANPAHKLVLDNGKAQYVCRINDKGEFGFDGHTEYLRFLANRLNGFPKKTVVRKTFPADDTQFLREIARDTWAFFDNVVDTERGLPLDTVVLGKDDPLGEGSSIGDYTNVTNIGIYLCSVVAAHDLGFITKDDAVSRLRKTLTTVRNLETSKWGFLYNYYDTTWGVKTDYFISLVDSGWLTAGMYVVKNAFPKELGSLCRELIDRGDFSFFYDPVEQLMWHGFYDNMGDYVNYHYGILYAEPRLTSLIAIGRGEVEEEHWFRMTRTFPEDYAWTTQQPKNRREKEYKGARYYGGWYEYKEHKFVPSWGGSMFEALMPALLIDERKFAPRSLGPNDEAHVKATIDYTLHRLQYPVWGMSPSSVPGDGYAEYGVKPLGAMGYQDGIITPHATFLALEFAPKEAVRNLRNMIADWDIYGEYGFYDGLDPLSKEVAYKYLALDQGMILIALDNYLNKGAIRRRFQGDPVFKKVIPLLRSENFFD